MSRTLRGPAPDATIPDAERPVEAGADRAQPARVLILSASLGEGHNSAARAMAADLAIEDPEAVVEVMDGLAALGWGIGRMIRKGYERQLRRMPWMYGLLYTLFRYLWPVRMLMRLVIADLGGRRLFEGHRRLPADRGRLDLPRSHDHPGPPAPHRPADRPRLRDDHRSGRARVLGRPGHRRALRHAPGVRGDRRTPGRTRERALGATSGGAGLLRTPRSRRGPPVPRPAAGRPARGRLGRRLGRRRPGGGHPCRPATTRHPPSSCSAAAAT